MLIVLMDEPGLFVFESVSAVKDHIEYQDAKEIRAVFDEKAFPYRVTMTGGTPIQTRRVSGFTVRTGGPTDYELVASEHPDPDGLRRLIDAHSEHATPAHALDDLMRLRNDLAGAGGE